MQQATRAQTTQLVKRHIIKNFNASKVSITTDVFSGGSSMDIRYTASTRIDELEAFIKTLQDGDFDPMQDLYTYRRDPVIIEGVQILKPKYVFSRREK